LGGLLAGVSRKPVSVQKKVVCSAGDEHPHLLPHYKAVWPFRARLLSNPLLRKRLGQTQLMWGR
jgi:hypothetical protein